MDKLEAKRFDYSIVDDDTRRKLISLAGEVLRKKKTGLQAMLEMGESISEAQKLLSKHKEGVFGKWIEEECGITPRTAYNYINAWRKFSNCESLSQLTAEAMYLLAAPNAPEAAFKKALKSAEIGVKVTEAVAKQIIKAVTPPREDTPRNKAEESGSSENSVEKTNGHADGIVFFDDEPVEEAESVREWGEGDSLEEVQEDLREFAKRCKAVNLFGRKVLRCDGDKITRPYCKEYSLTTLSHPLNHVARCITNDLPVGGTPARPVLYFQQKAAEAAR